MITVHSLKELLKDLPDDAKLRAYEGEGIGLIVRHPSGARGWIETGYDFNEEATASEHDLNELKSVKAGTT